MMELYVIKSESGYGRARGDGTLEWVRLEKASVYPSRELCADLLKRGREEGEKVRLAKLVIQEEDWV